MYDHNYKNWTMTQLVKEHHKGARFLCYRDTVDFELVKRLLKLKNNMNRENKILRRRVMELEEMVMTGEEA
jgi:hypothetical protein